MIISQLHLIQELDSHSYNTGRFIFGLSHHVMANHAAIRNLISNKANINQDCLDTGRSVNTKKDNR